MSLFALLFLGPMSIWVDLDSFERGTNVSAAGQRGGGRQLRDGVGTFSVSVSTYSIFVYSCIIVYVFRNVGDVM